VKVIRFGGIPLKSPFAPPAPPPPPPEPPLPPGSVYWKTPVAVIQLRVALAHDREKGLYTWASGSLGLINRKIDPFGHFRASFPTRYRHASERGCTHQELKVAVAETPTGSSNRVCKPPGQKLVRRQKRRPCPVFVDAWVLSPVQYLCRRVVHQGFLVTPKCLKPNSCGSLADISKLDPISQVCMVLGHVLRYAVVRVPRVRPLPNAWRHLECTPLRALLWQSSLRSSTSQRHWPCQSITSDCRSCRLRF
jgi:hypothetical protein